MAMGDQLQTSGSKRAYPCFPDTAPPEAKKRANGSTSAVGMAAGVPTQVNGDGESGSGAVAVEDTLFSPSGGDSESKAISRGGTDPDLQILEVTNDGDPTNMELLVHLKVSSRDQNCY